jgi:hypothetical protein
MAGRYGFGAVGCLAGVLGSVVVWSGCLLLFGTNLTFRGWAAVLVAGFVTGGLLSGLFWSKRDVRWVWGVLLPEARRAAIRPAALLAVLAGGSSTHQGQDELALLRQLAPALCAELTRTAKLDQEPPFGFEALPLVNSCGRKARASTKANPNA